MSQPPLEIIRHSCSHILASAVLKLYPGTKLGIGPSIENGFYYDFELPKPISEEDLEKITISMIQIIKTKLPFVKEEITIEEAKKLFEEQPYKLKLIDDLAKNGNKTVSIYKTGDPSTDSTRASTELSRMSSLQAGSGQVFIDLCEGPHLENTSQIGPFKLLSLAGAYWRGSEKNPMLTRIYGTCFPTQEELDHHLQVLAEAKKRDHKKLGPQLELFLFHETAPGIPYWLPKGVLIINELINFWRQDHEKRGYQEIRSPLINKRELYEISGHWEHYQEYMFLSQTEDKETYALKPMNCPNAMIVFGSKTRSYRDLPLRLSDTDTLHRYERSGALNGLLRVRGFTQDDAHIFIREDQIQSEYQEILSIAERFYSIFKIDYSFRLGTRPEKFMGDPKIWDRAEAQLEEILKESGRPHVVDSGDGAFYGPKIDILMKDSLGRQWQTGTIQLDFQIPQRFSLTYTDTHGKAKIPVVIHRVIYGSLERFIGILIEHYAGAFPVWLSPVQVVIIPITDRQNQYGREILKTLKEEDLRVELDNRNETTSSKIRDATLQKVPYMVIIGDRESQAGSITLRTRGGQDLGSMPLTKFIEKIKLEIRNKE